MENVSHENYHYAQDMGKTDTPMWLLDKNMDNYMTPDHTKDFETMLKTKKEYVTQPIEAPAKKVGRSVKEAFVERNVNDLREIGDAMKTSNNALQKNLGQAVSNFFGNPTSQNFKNIENAVDDINNIKYRDGSVLTPETQKFLSHWDNFETRDALRGMIR